MAWGVGVDCLKRGGLNSFQVVDSTMYTIMTLRWLCSFAYFEEPPSSLPSKSSELTCLKIYFTRSYLFFVLEYPSSVSHKLNPNHLHPSRWAFQAFLFQDFPRLWFLMLLVDVFYSISSHQCKSPVTLLVIALSEKESRNSVSIYILIEIFWCYMYTR